MAQAAALMDPSTEPGNRDPVAIETVPPEAPIVVVGNGPVGIRVARELLRRLPQTRLLIYGREPHRPYDRVRLSYWLNNEIPAEELHLGQGLPPDPRVEEHMGLAVTAIDPGRKCVIDQLGGIQPYSRLILATGSRPHVPGIPGIRLAGVLTFRDIDDTHRLLARRARSRHTVVLGGGLLGLEAARGMQRHNTRVTVIEHADRLLGRQLDEAASETLQAQIQSLGIRVVIGDGAAQILGDGRVEAIQLRSGRLIPCDTVVVATGIQPNVELALEARIALGRGIRVDDSMRTSQPDIYAVGECAEHRGQVYGLVGPGFEQAGVAAAHIAGVEGGYTGSLAASRLKVAGTQVFSMGPMGMDARPDYGRMRVFRDSPQGIYRKILVRQGRLEGAIGIGPWDDAMRLQAAIGRRQRILPWQLWRFRRTGSLWPAQEMAAVCQWPAAAVVCQCTGVTRGAIGEAVARGACTAQAVTVATGASSLCGSCRPLVQALLGDSTPKAVRGHRLLLGTAVATLIAALSALLLPAIPYPDSVQVLWRWDLLWRDGLIKQISGFSVLGLLALGLLVSPRKRLRRFQALGHFDNWRLAHVLLGLAVITGLLMHTGFRLGSGINLWLMLSFTGLLLIGGAATAVIAMEHRMGIALARRLRRQSLWAHLLLFWPVPALLGVHVLKTYWY